MLTLWPLLVDGSADVTLFQGARFDFKCEKSPYGGLSF